MLPYVIFQFVAVGSAAAAVVNFKLQKPFAFLDDSEPPHLPPFPFPRPKPPQPPSHTIYDLIQGDVRFSKLSRAVHFVGDEIISVLNNTNERLTFFAIPDKALVPPGHGDGDDDGKKHKHKHGKKDYLLDIAITDSSTFDITLNTLLVDNALGFADAIQLIEELEETDCVMDDGYYGNYDDDGDGDDDGDDKKKRRKEIFRHIVKSILNYHILPHGAYDLSTLGHNTTYPTAFQVPKIFGGHGQRITVSHDIKEKKKKKHVKTITHINIYATVVAGDIKTDNGFIHVLDHPLLPPPAIFQELFLAQRHFSTFTSALQRTGLTDELDVRYVRNDEDEHGHLEGSTAVTVFAPVNEAFQRLPKRLQLYLFSPFGQHVLRKLLEYHIIPGVVAHADGIYNQTAETSPENPTPIQLASEEEPISTVNVTLATRFVNHTLEWSSEKFKLRGQEIFENKVFVNDRPVLVSDIVALNGAVHVLDEVLCPCHHHAGERGPIQDMDMDVATWENWESWLPQWAGELAN